MGALYLTVSNVDASVAFYKLLGGTTVANGPVQMVEFPGMYLVLEKGQPLGGSVGTIVDHFGFQVKEMKDWRPKWQAAGLTIEPITRPTQTLLRSPDGVRIEVLEDTALPTPIAAHHIHFFTSDVPGMRAWYVKTFGAVPGTRGQYQAADLPGINLTFTASSTPTVPTKGHALSAIGFEVKDLKAFLATLKAEGIKIDEPYTRVPGSSLARASITDPWGTTIVLTEGLARAQ